MDKTKRNAPKSAAFIMAEDIVRINPLFRTEDTD